MAATLTGSISCGFRSCAFPHPRPGSVNIILALEKISAQFLE
jgi:hypothetical protein